jgi:hypothetical protein
MKHEAVRATLRVNDVSLDDRLKEWSTSTEIKKNTNYVRPVIRTDESLFESLVIVVVVFPELVFETW